MMNGFGIEINCELFGGNVNGVMYQLSSIDFDKWVCFYSVNVYFFIVGFNLKFLMEFCVVKVELIRVKGGLKVIGVKLINGIVISVK